MSFAFPIFALPRNYSYFFALPPLYFIMLLSFLSSLCFLIFFFHSPYSYICSLKAIASLMPYLAASKLMSLEAVSIGWCWRTRSWE